MLIFQLNVTNGSGYILSLLVTLAFEYLHDRGQTESLLVGSRHHRLAARSRMFNKQEVSCPKNALRNDSRLAQIQMFAYVIARDYEQ